VSRARSILDACLPWAGLLIGIPGIGFVHQFGSAGMFNDCRGVSPGPLIIVAAIGLLLCLAAGIASWRSVRSDPGPRRVIGVISAGSAALFAFAIILPVIAALLLPPCFE
jgi:hypothetical protein